MAKKRRRDDVYASETYSHNSIHEDREYGFFWYEWLWKIARPIMVFLCALLIIIGLVSMVWQKVDMMLFEPVDPGSGDTVQFTIENGATITKIGQNLVEQQLLRNADVFKYIVQFKGLTSAISYGTYDLSPAMDVNEIIAELSSGSQTNERTITIIPGWTVEDIADYLVSQGAVASRDDFLKLCNEPEKFVRYSYALSSAVDTGALKGRKYALEGYLAPDTYRVFKSADAESIIKTLLSQGNTVIDNVFYADHTQYKMNDEGEYSEVEYYHSDLSMNQIITLASIIEREAANETDYARVSAVFYNRLNADWNLESDATITYLTGRNSYVLRNDEMYIDSAYNTYMNSGLPAGPICNPSSKAIMAAMYPDIEYIHGGYMYFCAKAPDTGEIAYAVTREEHEANVELYRPLWEAYEQLHSGN